MAYTTKDLRISELEEQVATLMQERINYLHFNGVDEIKEKFNMLIKTIEAHELYAYDCDRSGKVSCDCIEIALKEAKELIV